MRDYIWKRQYAIHQNESFQEGLQRVARHVAKAEKENVKFWEQKFYQLMHEEKFIPGGRILAGAETRHGNLLNCFVTGSYPYDPSTTEGVLYLAKKLALITKVGGGNGLNLDPIKPKQPFNGLTGKLYITISPDHTDYKDVREGKKYNHFTGQKEVVGYKAAKFDTNGEIKIKVEDSIEGIWDAAAEAAKRMLEGKSVLVDLSLLRPEGSLVKGSGGTSSGPASFAVEIFDNLAYWVQLGGADYAGPVATLRYIFAPTLRVIKQGGTRRGAGMATLSIEHPDWYDFLTAKDLDREAKEGDISTFNISFLVPDKFMEAAEGSEEGQRLRQIAEHSWATGEPGLIFFDTINKHNPLLKVDGPIRATNPCFVGDTRIPTEFGLVPIQQLTDKGSFYLATDNRAPIADIPRNEKGVTIHRAAKAFYTGERKVVRLETKEGITLTLTPNHRLLTPQGYIEAGQLKPGDKLLVQSGEGLWAKEQALPAEALKVAKERVLTAGNKNGNGRVDVREQYANLPTQWSENLGLVLGWLVGDGYLREDGVGFYFSNQEFHQVQFVVDTLRDWFGNGHLQATNFNTQCLRFNRIPAEFFLALGVKPVKAPQKRVPESIFTAPREAVVGFLRGLFSTDGTVNRCDSNRNCSARLASTSLGLLKDVQLLLLNFGIFSRIYHRRKAGFNVLPDGKGGMKEYPVADLYELIIYADSLVRFAEIIGFALPHKQAKLNEFISKYSRGPYRHNFKVTVSRIEEAGTAHVYDLTEPVTHSLIANGVVAHNCSEIVLYEGEPCDLGHLNLANFVKNGQVDYPALEEATQIAVRFLDNVLEVENPPLPDNKEAIIDKRRIGLGVMGLADMLIKLGLSYDSLEGREQVHKVIRYIVDVAIRASESLAEERGIPDGVRRAGLNRRNIAILTVAPTGTTSMLLGVSSGVEPVYAAAYVRRVGTENKQVVHPLLKEMLSQLHPKNLPKEAIPWVKANSTPLWDGNDWNWNLILEGIQAAHGSIQPLINKGWLPPSLRIFQVAHDVSPSDHVRMQATVQTAFDYTDNGEQTWAANSISKTINLPNTATVEDVLEAYKLAHLLGCKGITVYRDGSRQFQVLSTGHGDFETWAKKVADKYKNSNTSGMRVRESVINSKTYKYSVGGRKVYVNVGWNSKGEVVELWVNLSKPTPDEAVMTDIIGRLASLSFKYGASVDDVKKHLEGHYDQSGGLSPGLGFVNSMWEVVAKTLDEYTTNKNTNTSKNACPECSSELSREEGCWKCYNCGYSKCS